MNQISTKSNLDWASEYHSFGWSVFPVGTDKKPLIEWKIYQTQYASEDQIKTWWTQWPSANIGVATGKISNIVVVDVEEGGDISGLPASVRSRTGGGGWHYFYKYPGVEVKNSARIKPLTDIRGDGGYIVLPPSVHRSGKQYEWISSPFDSNFAESPDWVIAPKVNNNWQQITGGVSQGSRNDSAAKVIGKLLYELDVTQWETSGWDMAIEWNDRNSPPLSHKELRTVFDSIASRESLKRAVGDKDNPSQVIEGWPQALEFKDLISREFTGPQWIVENLIPSDCITVLSAPPAHYKSYWLAHIAIACATGGDVFENFSSMQVPVMIVNEEDTLRRIATRIKSMTAETDLPIYFHISDGFRLDNPVLLNNLLEEVKAKSIRLLILDTLVRVHGKDENNATEMNKVYEALKEFKKIGVAVLMAHHSKKQGPNKMKVSDISGISESMRGSSDILGMVDSHLVILSVKREDGRTMIVAVQTKQRDIELLAPFQIEVISDEDSIKFVYAGEHDADKTAVNNAKNEILELLNSEDKGATLKIIEPQLEGIAKSASIRIGLRELEDDNKIFAKTFKQLSPEIQRLHEKGSKGSTKYYFRTKDENSQVT